MTDTPKRPLSAFFADHAVDLAALAGAGLITWGAWQVYHPAAPIIAGAFMLAGAWLLARKGA